MKHQRSALAVAVIALAVAGCTKEEPAAPSVSSAPEPPAMPRLQPGANALAAPEAAPKAPAPPPPIDFTAAERPTDEHDRPLSDLELLNQALLNYNESHATGVNEISRAYKTEEEQMAAEEARQRAIDVAPVKDLSELVKAGVIKAIPKAPAGQKYAIDPQTREVMLVPAP